MSDHKTIELAILGMNCDGCGNTVRNALCDVLGVSDAKVSFEEGSATITLEDNADVSAETLIEAVKDAGYDATLSS